MNDKESYETEPEKFDGNYEDYVWAVCKCPVDMTYGLKIPQNFSNDGRYPFRCKKCGLEGIMYVGKEVVSKYFQNEFYERATINERKEMD